MGGPWRWSVAARLQAGSSQKPSLIGVRGASASAVCKPSSVPLDACASFGDGHPSGAAGRPTAHAADPRAGQRTSPPAGRPARVAPSYLALLRVEFARFTPPPDPRVGDGIVTVALVLVSRRTGVTRHPALWSSDFPHGPGGSPRPASRDHPTGSLTSGFYVRQSFPEGIELGLTPVLTPVSVSTVDPPFTSRDSISPTFGTYDLCSTVPGSRAVNSSVTTAS